MYADSGKSNRRTAVRAPEAPLCPLHQNLSDALSNLSLRTVSQDGVAIQTKFHRKQIFGTCSLVAAEFLLLSNQVWIAMSLLKNIHFIGFCNAPRNDRSGVRRMDFPLLCCGSLNPRRQLPKGAPFCGSFRRSLPPRCRKNITWKGSAYAVA